MDAAMLAYPPATNNLTSGTKLNDLSLRCILHAAARCHIKKTRMYSTVFLWGKDTEVFPMVVAVVAVNMVYLSPFIQLTYKCLRNKPMHQKGLGSNSPRRTVAQFYLYIR